MRKKFELNPELMMSKEDAVEVKFSGSVSGSFKGVKAAIVFDKNHLEQSKISAAMDAGTIATGLFPKNSHAKSAWGADDYPVIKFISITVTESNCTYNANGLLTVKGITGPATILFTFDDKGAEGTFLGSFRIISKDFSITRSGTPDEVTISSTGPVVKPN